MSVDIPNYRIVEKLGVGAETRVYRARCMRTGKDYTVKVVKISKPEDATYIDLMKSEHMIGSAIDHPAVRKIYELRYIRQRLRVRGAILFMEYVDGITLSDKEYRKTLDETLRIFSEVAHGLYAMHRAGFVHADLKPSNILVTRDDEVKLIDLGQSSRIGEAKLRVQGTIDFIAPEQVQRGILNERTDVFGLGAALHRVLTGVAIATDMNQKVSVHSQSLLGKRVEDLKKPTMQELPICVSRLIDDCCQTNPASRLSGMPAIIERIALARTMLAREIAPTVTGAVQAEDEHGSFDEADDDSFDVDDFDPFEEAISMEEDELDRP